MHGQNRQTKALQRFISCVTVYKLLYQRDIVMYGSTRNKGSLMVRGNSAHVRFKDTLHVARQQFEVRAQQANWALVTQI
jgi:hypothetical protein